VSFADHKALESTPTSSGSSTLASVPVNTDSNVPAHRLTESYDESSNLKPTPTRLSPRQPDDLVKPIPGNCSAQQQAEQMEVDMNQSRRKRRRTTLPKVKLEDTPAAEQLSPSSPTRDTPSGEPSENDSTLGVGDVKQPAHAASLLSKQPKDTQTEFQSPTSIVSPRNPPNRCDTLEAVESANLNTIPQQDQNRDEALDIRNIYQKPKKILHFNSKTGTIGSPPAKGSVNAIEGTSTETPPLKNRKRASSLIIGVKYGQNAKERLSIGNKINQIFEHKKPVAVLEKQKTDVKEPPRKVEKSKSTHPFFLGKAALKPSINESSDSSPLSAIKPDKDTPPKSALPSTRAKARSPTRSSFPPAKSNNFPTFGNSNKLLKFPGAVEPIWPPRDMAHVRGPMDCPPRIQPKDISIPISFHEHKSKYTASEATAQEDILQIITAQLAIKEIQEELKNVDTDSYKPPDRCLRLPGRHFESGIKLQCRIKSQIKSTLNSDNFAHDSSEDELAQVNPRSVAHPVIRKIYDSIPHSLSAFDKSEYQTQSWIHKYSPSCAEEVLQSGREAFILKEWLQTLTVLAVDTGMGEGNSSRPTPGLPKQSGSKSEKGGKRKRKSKKLDGFIVSSDDEANDMDEISDLEDDFPRGSQGNKKTLIRRGDAIAKSSKEPSKLLNAVVISGSNGCGKTAAVYAVAKELDFEIFEINSSTRRSGKDILERVGEMTKNHLVQHKQQRINEDDGGLQRASDAAEADLKSGRQGTMKSFFKATAPKAKESNLKPRQDVDQKSKTAGQTSSKKPIKQKQSLILLEEVDILFEEDKQFWVTVLGLIMQSKRPIIMTCNDESVVLNQALPLHAIIRFTPPPLDLAVDYMLLVAANEGHVLQRQAVTALYQAQKYDLRASMTELEFWCQFGVGDRRGGFDWFFPRLPRGVDKDPHGNTIRVVSQDTYKTGMGWLGRDSLCDPFGINDIEDEILRETWDGWQLDAGDWYDTLKLGSWTDKMPMIPVEQRLSALEYYDEFTEALSVADLCACGEFGMDNAVSSFSLYYDA
jgi:DNA polymerase III delta prime subunit